MPLPLALVVELWIASSSANVSAASISLSRVRSNPNERSASPAAAAAPVPAPPALPAMPLLAPAPASSICLGVAWPDGLALLTSDAVAAEGRRDSTVREAAGGASAASAGAAAAPPSASLLLEAIRWCACGVSLCRRGVRFGSCLRVDGRWTMDVDARRTVGGAAVMCAGGFCLFDVSLRGDITTLLSVASDVHSSDKISEN